MQSRNRNSNVFLNTSYKLLDHCLSINHDNGTPSTILEINVAYFIIICKLKLLSMNTYRTCQSYVIGTKVLNLNVL